MRGAAVVACDESAAAAVDANDVATATARAGGAPGIWEVGATLTDEGSARFSAIARQVGVGAELAIVVDGAVVSAPTLQTTNFPSPAPIVITGIDQAGAKRPAARLNRR